MEDKNRFPTGMRVLAVDDNSTCLIILEALLRSCQYNVTTAKEATTALQILREKENEIDLVMSEVDLPGMDGFRLLEEVSRQTDIPVVLVSWDDNKEGVMKGVANGACDYLLKPVRMEELKNIWQHVVRRNLRKNNNNCNKYCCRELTIPHHDVDQMPSNTCTDGKKRKDDEIKEEVEYDHERGQQQQQKKPRVVWLPDLHQKFVAAVDQLGVDKAVPKRILELMDVKGISRENVASHLQKYRVSLKKSSKGQANIMFAKFGSAYYGDQVDNRQQIIRGGSTSRRCASYPASMLGSRLNNPHQENYSNHHWGRHSDYSNNNLMYAINDHDEADNNIHYSIHTTMNEQTSSTSLLLLHGGNQMPMPIPSGDDFSVNCCDDSNNNNSVMLEGDQHLSNATANHPLPDQRRYGQNNNDNSEWPPSAAIRVCRDFYLPSDTSSSADVAIIPHQIQGQHHGASYNYSTTPLCQNIIRREFPKDSSSPVQSSYDHCMNNTQSHQSNNILQNHLKQPSSEELQQ